jgi:CRISPR-associated exonuclease Cas4
MDYKEEVFLLLAGIQHYVFCKRQWALIHIEQQWQENILTIEGKILHERTHDSILKEKRGDLIISRGMPVFSHKLGLVGVCDVVEFHKSPDGIRITGSNENYKPIPIEYKRGKPKKNDSDILQLCAQAICLEEMLACEIHGAFLYYDQIKRRVKISIDNNLRERVNSITKEMHQLYDRRHTPKVRITKRCKACSLSDYCMPRLCKNISANNYIKRCLQEVEE